MRRPAARLTDLEEPVLRMPRKLAISGNLPPIMSSRTRSRQVHKGVEGAALQIIFPTIQEVDEKDDKRTVSVCDGGGSMAFQVKVDIPESIAGDISPEPKNRQQALN